MKTSGIIAIALNLVIASVSLAAGTTRTLTCSNTAGSFAVTTCGGSSGCTATIKLGSVSKKYSVVRSRTSEGSFQYTPKAGASNKCTIVLRSGSHYVKKASCATQLKGAQCSVVVS